MARSVPVLAVVVVGLVVALCATGAAASPTTIRRISTADGTGPEFPVGATLTVEGTTSLRPDDNVIVVDVRNADGDVVAETSTDRWGYDGDWNVTVETAGLAAGEYTVSAEDGYGTDVETVRLVESTPTATSTPTETPTPEPTPTAEPTETPTTSSTAARTPTGSPTRSGEASPTRRDGAGFGAVEFAFALGGVALAARARRRD